MRDRILGWLACVLVVTTLVWVGTTIATEATSPPAPTLAGSIATLEDLNPLFSVTYLNAALITLLTTALFAGLYLYCHRHNEFWATVAVIFIPEPLTRLGTSYRMLV
jgi:hypothetical protein